MPGGRELGPECSDLLRAGAPDHKGGREGDGGAVAKGKPPAKHDGVGAARDLLVPPQRIERPASRWRDGPR
jgi:hypothetical protein